MKETFFEFHQQEKLPELLKEGIIILDTNALLNLYRYNEEVSLKYFEILETVKDRLFLTHQATEEFYRNRLTIINNKARLKEDLINILSNNFEQIKNLIENPNNFNKEGAKLLKYEEKLKDNLLFTINNGLDIIIDEISQYDINITETFIQKDDLLDKIEKIFSGKINSSCAPSMGVI